MYPKKVLEPPPLARLQLDKVGKKHNFFLKIGLKKETPQRGCLYKVPIIVRSFKQ